MEGDTSDERGQNVIYTCRVQLLSLQRTPVTCSPHQLLPKEDKLKLHQCFMMNYSIYLMQMSKSSYLAVNNNNSSCDSQKWPVQLASHARCILGLFWWMSTILWSFLFVIQQSVKCAGDDEVPFPPTVSLISSLSPLSCVSSITHTWAGCTPGCQAWIRLNHPLPLPVPRPANSSPWADADDGKRHSRTSERGGRRRSGRLGCYYSFTDGGGVDRVEKRGRPRLTPIQSDAASQIHMKDSL